MATTSKKQKPTYEELVATIQELQARIVELEAELAKARKNSETSSKPPSSDVVNPKPKNKKPGRPKKRKRGGQPGHSRHERQAFEESEIDKYIDYYLDGCPDCGGHIELDYEKPRTLQQVDFVPAPIIINEHRSLGCWCESCQKMHYAPIPEDVRQAGLVGPRLTALVAYLKGACHCSFSTIRKFIRDVVGVKISRGHLRKVCAKNLVDSENMLGMLKSRGFNLASSIDEAEVAVINTCGFIQPAVEEAIDTILEFVNLKKHGILLKH